MILTRLTQSQCVVVTIRELNKSTSFIARPCRKLCDLQNIFAHAMQLQYLNIKYSHDTLTVVNNMLI